MLTLRKRRGLIKCIRNNGGKKIGLWMARKRHSKQAVEAGRQVSDWQRIPNR